IDPSFAQQTTPSSTATTATTGTSTTAPATSTGGKGGGGGIPGGTGGSSGSASDAALAKLGIVFDNGSDILIMGAKSGKPVKKLAATPDVEVTPAMSPHGSEVAYARGKTVDKTQIWLVDPKKPQ